MNDQIKFHIGLHVSNIENTVAFYQDLFGTEPVKVKEDYAKFELDNPGLVISFIHAPGEVSRNFGHLGFRVLSANELKEKRTLIEGKLNIALEEQNTNCCYSRQDKFWVNDPDGYQWEVYHIKDETPLSNKKHELSACC